VLTEIKPGVIFTLEANIPKNVSAIAIREMLKRETPYELDGEEGFLE